MQKLLSIWLIPVFTGWFFCDNIFSFFFVWQILIFLIHRELNYVVVFPEYQTKHHTFLIKQLLPSSVYVSIDQLNDLNRFDKVNIY